MGVLGVCKRANLQVCSATIVITKVKDMLKPLGAEKSVKRFCYSIRSTYGYLKSMTKKEVPDTVERSEWGIVGLEIMALTVNKKLWRTCCSAKFSFSQNNVNIGIFT